MELTTQQIYALFTILAVMVAFIGVAYCVGLKTGRRSADEQMDNLRADLINTTSELGDEIVKRDRHLVEVQRLLDSRDREIRSLRLNIEQEISDHQAFESDLQQELAAARASALTPEDLQALIKASRQLDLTAKLFDRSGSTKKNHSAIYRDALTAIAAKVQAVHQGQYIHPDTELIEWLDREGTFWADHETGEIRFMFAASPNGHPHIRDVLKLAKQQAEEIEQNHATTLQEAAA